MLPRRLIYGTAAVMIAAGLRFSHRGPKLSIEHDKTILK